MIGQYPNDNLEVMDGKLTIYFKNVEIIEFDGKWGGYRDGWILFIADDGHYIQVKEDEVVVITTKKRLSL